MKTRTLLLSFLITATIARAQDPTDALRYSWLTPGGTARSQAVGSATTALGGDLSSLFTNPAGLGFYKTGEMVITPGYSLNNAKTNYLGSEQKDSKNNMNYGTMGFVFSGGGSRNGAWKNLSFGLGVNRLANFNGSTYLKGYNDKSSYSEKYLEELTDNNVTDPNAAASNYPYGSSLAFNTYLVDTVQGPGGSLTGYRSLATPQTGVDQQEKITTRGGIADYSIGIAGNLQDKFYIGASVGVTLLKYGRDKLYTETDATQNPNNNFKYFTSGESLTTEGSGINLRLGMIFKPVENLRLGLSFQTPTMYNLKDVYTATVTTDLEGYAGSGVLTQSSLDLTNNEPGNYQYSYTAPLKASFGFSYAFAEQEDVTKQRGFITADVEYIDYKGSKFHATDGSGSTYFDNLNNTIRSYYKSAFNYRVGGELKFNTIMVRGGFGYYANPFANETDKGSRMNISGGLGYRNKGVFVDLTYAHLITKANYYPYQLTGNTFYPAAVKDVHGGIVLTVGFKF